MRVTAIIAAGGSGRRLGAAVPKQLLDLAGQSMLARSVGAFDRHPKVDEVIVALPVDLVDSARTIVGKVTGPIRYVAGGGSRQDSVARAFELVGEQTDIVLVHDAARPFVSADLITRAIAAAADYGAAIAAVPVTDTVKRVTPDPAAPTIVGDAGPRGDLPGADAAGVSTSRCFGDAIALGRTGVDATDEAGLAERAGHAVRVVEGDRANVKITTPADLDRARAHAPAIRRPIGGACRHRLRSSSARGRPAVDPWRSDNPVYCGSARPLGRGCGVPRRHRRGARRGVARRYRPPLSRQRSAVEGCVEHRCSCGARRRLTRDAGFDILNLDVVVILERPRIAPFIDRIRAGPGRRRVRRPCAGERQGQEQRRRGRGRPRRGNRRTRRCAAGGPPESVMRVRFAPSPTGQLHVGNARTALFNWLLAHGKDGTLVLRIEDTDTERSSRESEVGILEDLRWLGLHWDEGPDVGGAHGPYRQSERLHLYASYANELLAGGHAYHCFCSAAKLEDDRRQDLAAGLPPKYRGTCRNLSPDEARARIDAGERPVIRFRVPEHVEVSFQDLVRGEVTFSSEVIGDSVLVRSNGRPAYNFAVVVDDALMEITHVIRGEDHISNTPRQVLLYQALGFAPPAFAHLALVMGPDHTPLSKRHGATSVAEFRARGFLPEALTNYLALIGWSPGGDQELLPIDELARRFAIEDVGHSAGVFDPEKLAWMNRHYMKMAAPARLSAESCAVLSRARLPSSSIRRGDGISRLDPADGDRHRSIGSRRFRIDCGSCSSSTRPRRSPARTSRKWSHEPGAREVIAALAEELRPAGPPRSRRVSRRGQPRQAADRPEGARAVPPDSRRADRRGRRPGAGPRRAGNRSRRRAALVRRHRTDHRLSRAGAGVRGGDVQELEARR